MSPTVTMSDPPCRDAIRAIWLGLWVLKLLVAQVVGVHRNSVHHLVVWVGIKLRLVLGVLVPIPGICVSVQGEKLDGQTLRVAIELSRCRVGSDAILLRHDGDEPVPV